MEEERKLTKKELYEMVKEVITNADVEDKDELISFVDRQIEILENKAVKSRERAAEKRAAGDELRASVKAVLTSEFQTADEITSALNDEEITKAKVIARLTQLVKAGEAEKEDAKVDSGRTIKVYRLAE